jgi:4-amino-4-deoxy-L-arabinose transferase-like glycosyltransferase
MMTGNTFEIENPNLVKSNLVLIFGIALALRLFNLAVIDDLTAYAMVEDSSTYWNGALEWIESGSFSLFDGTKYVPRTERVPLYFLFLVPIRWMFGDLIGPALVAQAVLDASTCVVIALLGGMIDRTTGIVAGLLAAAWPNMIIHSALILTDTLFVFFISVGLLFTARFVKSGKTSDILVASFISGLSIMTRIVAMFIPIGVFVVTLIVLHRQGSDWRKCGATALVTIIIAALPVAPLVVRNINQFDTAQLTSQTGTHILGWVVGYSQALERGESFEITTHRLSKKLLARRKAQPDTKRLTSFEASRERISLAQEELARMSVSSILKAWLVGVAVNLAAPVTVIDPRIRALNKNSYYNSVGDSLAARLLNFLADNDSSYIGWLFVGLITGTIALAFQIAGWAILFRRQFWPAILAMLFILYILLINGPIGSPKYRLPMDPVFIILQSIAIVSLWKNWRHRSTKKLWSVP